MKYIKFTMHNGYCGCDEEEYEAFKDNVSEKEIEDYANDLLVNFYSYYEDDSFIEDDDDYDNAMTDYQMDCYVDYGYITKEEYEENVCE